MNTIEHLSDVVALKALFAALEAAGFRPAFHGIEGHDEGGRWVWDRIEFCLRQPVEEEDTQCSEPQSSSQH